MSKIISIHEYVLKPGIDDRRFEDAIRAAQDRQLFRLPGLVDFYFIKGIKGTRKGDYTAVWIYESREAWERLWGSLQYPRGKRDYPKNWQVWEDEILKPLLIEDPDKITFTAYEVLQS